MAKIGEIEIKPSMGLRAELAKLRRVLENLPRQSQAEVSATANDVIRRLEEQLGEEQQDRVAMTEELQKAHRKLGGAQVESDHWRRNFHSITNERDQARAARDTWAALRDGAQRECNELREKLDKWNADQKLNRDAALEQAIHFRKAAEHARDAARKERDEAKEAHGKLPGQLAEATSNHHFWKGRCDSLEDHIKDEAIRSGINPTHLNPWQLVSTLAEARKDASSWEGSYARLKAVIHKCAADLNISIHGPCRHIVQSIAAQTRREKTLNGALKKSVDEAQEELKTVMKGSYFQELQAAETGIRDRDEKIEELKQDLKTAQTQRDYWQLTHEEQESYYAGGIKDDAKRAGLDTRGLAGMAIVHEMVDEIQKCHQVRSAYWDSVREAIRHMEDGGSYHAVADALRRVQDVSSKAYGAPPPDQSAELQRRCDLLEVGVREAQRCLQNKPLPLTAGARNALRLALERTGLDGCQPVESPCETCNHKGCANCSLGAKKMKRGALKQARDLLVQVERDYEPQQGWKLQTLAGTMTKQRCMTREAQILLETVLKED